MFGTPLKIAVWRNGQQYLAKALMQQQRLCEDSREF
jgi:hypothetical protein